MAQLLDSWDYVVLASTLAVSACIGIYFRFTGDRQKSLEQFLLGGRNMSILPVAISLLATFLSAIAILGVPAEIYLYGLQLSAMLLGLPLGYFLCAFGCLPIYFDLKVSTSYEYLEIRFGKTIRNIAAFLYIIRSIFYTALALYTPSLALNAVTGISTWISVLTLTAVCSFYCSLGGLKAVVWTDVFQTILMFIPLVAIIASGILAIGFRKLLEINTAGGRMIFFNMSFDLTERYTFSNCVLLGAYIMIEFSTTKQAQVQRLLSVGNFKKAQWALFWGMVLVGIFKIFLFFTGMILYGIFHDCDPVQNPEVQLGSADQILPYTILKMFGGILFLPGLCISGIFSGALSSVSSALNTMAVVTVEDFMKPYCKCSQFTSKWMNIIAKLLAIAFGCLSILLIVFVSQFRGIFEAAYVINDPISVHNALSCASHAAISDDYLLYQFYSGAVLGFIVGFAFNCWIGFGNYMSEHKIVTLPRSISGCASSATESAYSWQFYQNFTEAPYFDTKYQNITIPDDVESRYTFPLYKLSSVWMMSCGMAVSFIVGYISSLLLGHWKEYPSINPKCLSPFLRRLYFTSSDIAKAEQTTHEVEIKQKQMMADLSPKIHNFTQL
ncbi:sodium-coupled monocarboxylate transporter 1-like isoform X2 [Argiope bruennichi]|uniref:sodium-coupled monocarboxylate transporter 1-like isoform X2 n=1 Tax=Argiope bruennichi TaxID=94029 RepID=UPI002494046D|nr:sodium-coupled monocarboxylate transporter 1-like isoform X2 [Argiope bruennichi]